jgi:hypothetical protein
MIYLACEELQPSSPLHFHPRSLGLHRYPKLWPVEANIGGFLGLLQQSHHALLMEHDIYLYSDVTAVLTDVLNRKIKSTGT